MQITATVIADSIYWPTPDTCHRLTTLELIYPRFIHSELMTHRAFSRNAASSRAIPVSKMLKQVWSDPAMPVFWGSNKPGMQAGAELTGLRLKAAKALWVAAGWVMVCFAWVFSKLGLHKQIANRILEPWMWMKTIVSATDWGNFLNLRRHPAAQPEFKALADQVWNRMLEKTPKPMAEGAWHLPYVDSMEKALAIMTTGWPKEQAWEYLRKLSAARCARVSYLNHDGTKPDAKKDLELHEKLIAAPHASPFEHQATPKGGRHGNFTGWMQYRQLIPRENQPEYTGIWPYRKQW